METVKVDKEKCIGCGICISEHPEYFEFDDDAQSKVIKTNVESNDKEGLIDIIERCPVEAIIIEETA